MQIVPLEVARLAGAGDRGEFATRGRKVVLEVARALPTFDGSTDLDAWLLDAARSAIAPLGGADDPDELAELVDVDATLDEALPQRSRPTRRRSGFSATLRRARHVIRVGLVAAVIALFFWADPLVDTDSGRDVEQVFGGEIMVDYPVGAVTDFGRFEWRGAGEVNYRAQVIVQSNDGRSIVSPMLETDLWEPSASQIKSFGNRIRWTVQVRFDGEVERGWADAWLDVR